MNNGFLRQSTASQIVLLGPFLDDTDFKTAETALSIANTDIRLSKAGGAFGNKNSGGGTHMEGGVYSATLNATDTDTVGTLMARVTVSGALPVVHKFTVIEETVYDALFASGSTWGLAYVHLSNVTEWDGNAIDGPFYPPVDLKTIDGTAIPGGSPAGFLPVDVRKWNTNTPLSATAGRVPAVIQEPEGLVVAGTAIIGAVITGSVTATTFAASALPSSVDGVYVDRVGQIISGTLTGRAFFITGYDGATKTITVDALPSAPSISDAFVILA